MSDYLKYILCISIGILFIRTNTIPYPCLNFMENSDIHYLTELVSEENSNPESQGDEGNETSIEDDFIGALPSFHTHSCLLIPCYLNYTLNILNNPIALPYPPPDCL